ncbi:hypothetical protein BV394_05325 [Brevirhabdus pacifica]|uniref:Uncharacterized protein n=1 Tax=Brevirhabdus pacifica TaxID=1267768 RepID=A0A1U7DGT5_9RHOB|nr:rod-binding protein [Brevirhabdus pacifica]APX89207.1 hypothetical protein BV394_05325 [Brevirhabdus pacifica]OWU76746.1 hypothetical protein ATO5_10960 [Loktanella sp. 22II-4b]PJJ86190.1 rod binding protein [Brevirhabdus pacifica]
MQIPGLPTGLTALQTAGQSASQAAGQAAANRAGGQGGADPADPAAKTAREFEALFLTQAVDEMMKTVDLGSFAAGSAEETWRSFLSRAIADEIAGQAGAGTGIARSVESTIAAYGRAAAAEGDK